MAVPLILALIMLLIVALNFRNGLWNNTLLLINTFFAGLLATCYFESLAAYLASAMPGLGDYWDILSFWAIYGAAFSALRWATERLSKFKLRMTRPLDMAGGAVMSAATGWVMVCLVSFSLHTAPLAREFLWGSFVAEEPVFFDFSPDRLWLGMMQKTSLGLLARSAPEDQPELYVFDPQGDFMLRYAARRLQSETVQPSP